MLSSKEKDQLFAYLAIMKSRLAASLESETSSTARADAIDQVKGYETAINDIANWLDPEFVPEVDYEDIADHIADRYGIDH